MERSGKIVLPSDVFDHAKQSEDAAYQLVKEHFGINEATGEASTGNSSMQLNTFESCGFKRGDARELIDDLFDRGS